MSGATSDKGPIGRPVLVVDDSSYARLRVRRLLETLGAGVVLEAANGDEALDLFKKERPGLVLLDQVMRGKDGIEVAREVHELDPFARLVMLTVLSDPDLRERAKAAGVRVVIEKGRLEELRAFLEEASVA